jgi:hypothetical protein
LSSTSNYFALSSFSADLYLEEKRTAIFCRLEKTLEAGQKMVPPMQVAISTMRQEFQADYEARLAFVKERLDKVQKALEDVRAKMNEQGLLVTRYCTLARSYFTRFPHLSPCSSSMSAPHDDPCFYPSSPFSAPYPCAILFKIDHITHSFCLHFASRISGPASGPSHFGTGRPLHAG